MEKRYGGEAETPTKFWPPTMGPVFNTEEERAKMDFMTPSEYEVVIEENPDLIRSPEFINSEEQNTRDFKFDAPETIIPEPEPVDKTEKTDGNEPEVDHPLSVSAVPAEEDSEVNVPDTDGENVI